MTPVQQSQLAYLCTHCRRQFLSSVYQNFGWCNKNGMELHLQINTLYIYYVFTAIITNHPWKRRFLQIFVISYTHQPGKTFSLTASCNSPVPDPLETTASIPHKMKSQSVWTPGSFVTHQTQVVLIAAHSWDNIPWDFPGRWKVLLARIEI